MWRKRCAEVEKDGHEHGRAYTRRPGEREGGDPCAVRAYACVDCSNHTMQIRSIRPPNAYTGNGILYAEETPKLKARKGAK